MKLSYKYHYKFSLAELDLINAVLDLAAHANFERAIPLGNKLVLLLIIVIIIFNSLQSFLELKILTS